MAGTLRVRVVSPEKVVFQGDAGALVVPAWDGMLGILPGPLTEWIAQAGTLFTR